MPTLLPNISALDWSPKRDQIGDIVENIDDINQCIRTILETPKGSRPHEPLFGADLLQFIDWPVNLAMPGIIAEVIDSVTLWEPRAEIVKISATPDTVTGSRLYLSIDWKLNGDDTGASVEVNIVAA